MWQIRWGSFLESFYVPTPHRSETDGIVERTVRRIKEETSAILLQSGLVDKKGSTWLLDAKSKWPSVSDCRPLTRQDAVEHWNPVRQKRRKGRLRMDRRRRRSARESQEWVIYKRKRMSRRCNEGEGAGGGEEGAGGGEEGAGGGREKERACAVNARDPADQGRAGGEDDDCKDEGRGYSQMKYGDEWTDFVKKKTRRWRQEKETRRHKKQRPCRKTRIREKKETVVEPWRHKKKAKFTLKRKEDTRPKVRLSKKRNRRTSMSSDSDL